jgi:hypothetical protein
VQVTDALGNAEVMTFSLTVNTSSTQRSKRTQPYVNTSPWNTPASAAGSIAGLFSAPIFGSNVLSVFSATVTGFAPGVYIDPEFNITTGSQTSLPYAVASQFLYEQSVGRGGSYGTGGTLCALSGTNAYNSTAGDALANTIDGGAYLNKYPIPNPFAAQTATYYGNIGWTVGYAKNNDPSAILLGDDDTISSNQQFSRCTASGSIGTGFLRDTPVLSGYSGYASFSPSIKTGDGRFGPHGGSGLSALGGSLRLFDLQHGVIAHCLKLDFPRGVLWGNSGAIPPANYSVGECYPTGTNGYSNTAIGYVWPAYNVDGGTPAYIGTNNKLKMGSLLQIPSNVSLSSLGPLIGYTAGFETTLGLMLATCAQDYGFYPCDTTGGTPSATGNTLAIEVAVEPDATTGAIFGSSGAYAGADDYCVKTFGFSMYQGNGSNITWPAYVRDVYRILSALCVNLLNGPSDGVHGSGGGTAIVPYLTNSFSD